MNSMTSTSNLYTDARAELEEQLIRDPEQGDRKYLRLPSPSLRFPGVFVHNGGTTWGNAKWHVSCEFSSPVADAEKALALAEALSMAARQAAILNAPRRVLTVPRVNYDSDVSTVNGKPTGRLVMGIRAPYGYTPAIFGGFDHLDGRPIGYQWGADGYRYEFLGHFQYLGAKSADGREQALFAEVGEAVAA